MLAYNVKHDVITVCDELMTMTWWRRRHCDVHKRRRRRRVVILLLLLHENVNTRNEVPSLLREK
jgi:hypothetical protein